MNERPKTLEEYQALSKTLCERIHTEDWFAEFLDHPEGAGQFHPTSLFIIESDESPYLTDFDSYLDPDGHRQLNSAKRLQLLMPRNGRAYWQLIHHSGTPPPEFISELSLDDYQSYGEILQAKMEMYANILHRPSISRAR